MATKAPSQASDHSPAPWVVRYKEIKSLRVWEIYKNVKIEEHTPKQLTGQIRSHVGNEDGWEQSHLQARTLDQAPVTCG